MGLFRLVEFIIDPTFVANVKIEGHKKLMSRTSKKYDTIYILERRVGKYTFHRDDLV